DPPRARLVALDAEAERLDPAQREPAVLRARHGADRVLEELELLVERLVARHERAAEDVRVAVDVLGRRVEHDVRSELERALDDRRRERVVDDDERSLRAGELRAGGYVRDLEERVRRRLEPEELRLLRERRLDGGEVLRVHEVELDAELGVELREDAPGPAVEVLRRDDPVP